MAATSYSLAGIHLPQNPRLTHALRVASFIFSCLVLLITPLLLIQNTPLILAVLFALTAGSLLFHATEKSSPAVKFIFPLIHLLCGALVSLICLGALIGLIRSLNPRVALSFLGLGVSLMLPYVKTPNFRFRTAQGLAFFVLVATAIPLLTQVYQLLLPPVSRVTTLTPFSQSLALLLLCQAILLRWPGRGVVGVFATQSLNSMYALRLLLVSLASAPFIGAAALLLAPAASPSLAQVTATTVVLYIALSTILAWLNLKLLYRHELEHFVMQEELRVHNIHLKLSAEDMAAQVQQLESTSQQYVSKLNYQDNFRDLAESLG